MMCGRRTVALNRRHLSIIRPNNPTHRNRCASASADPAKTGKMLEEDEEVIGRLFSRETTNLAAGTVFKFQFQKQRLDLDEIERRIGPSSLRNVFNGTEAREIEMKGIKLDFFVKFLKFAYLQQVELTDLGNLYMMARDFRVDQSLLQELSAIADSALTLDNSMTIFDQNAKTLHRFKHPGESLCAEVVPLVQAHTFYVVNTPAFLQIGQRGLVALLKNDCLFILEKDLYYAVMKWIDSDLKRKKLDQTLENRRNRFAPFKPFVRFSTMTASEFFVSDKPNSACRFPEAFSDTEVEQYRSYFAQNDQTVLSHIPESLKCPRFPATIGRLLLRPDKLYNFNFEMSTVADDLHDRRETDKFDPFRVQNDAECQISEISDNYSQVFRPPPAVDAKRDNLEPSKQSIKVFRIQATQTRIGWMCGEYLEIYQDGKPMTIFYKRYRVDRCAFFYNFFPAVELMKGRIYEFRFVNPKEETVSMKFKLTDVLVCPWPDFFLPSVQFETESNLTWSHVKRMFFKFPVSK